MSECPCCGMEGKGDEVLATSQLYCPTPSEECPVVSFMGDAE